ncbi:MAG: hypothetical protein U0930_13780 [Pirellulales bacterium]
MYHHVGASIEFDSSNEISLPNLHSKCVFAVISVEITPSTDAPALGTPYFILSVTISLALFMDISQKIREFANGLSASWKAMQDQPYC